VPRASWSILPVICGALDVSAFAGRSVADFVCGCVDPTADLVFAIVVAAVDKFCTDAINAPDSNSMKRCTTLVDASVPMDASRKGGSVSACEDTAAMKGVFSSDDDADTD